MFLLFITVPVVYLAFNTNFSELQHQSLRSQPNTQNDVQNDLKDDVMNDSITTSPPTPPQIITNDDNRNSYGNNNNLIQISLPDTLHYTFPQFDIVDLYHGRYETQVIESERESINKQSQIMAEHVKKAMKFFWKGYEKCAFGYDEVKPVSCKGDNNWGGMGMTIIDSLDTLFLMDLKDELMKGEKWLIDNLHFNFVKKELQVFEITIRALGGLLSMYSLTRNDFYKSKAVELGDILVQGVMGNLPRRGVVLSQSSFSGGMSLNLAEVGSFQLEYNYLTKITSDQKYRNKAYFVQQYLISNLKNGLIQMNTIKCPLSVGAEADSAYEYILKCWIQTGKTDNLLRDTFDKNKIAFKNFLSKRSSKYGILTVGANGSPEMEHLTCFLPGLIALDAFHNNNKTLYNEDMEFAKSLAFTCYQMYMNQTFHLSPEVVRIYNDEMHISNTGYKQRPETVESLYILHEITGDPIYVKWGWDIFLAIEKYTKVENGYSGLDNININGTYSDKAESYFPAETLKYLYLLFDTYHKIDLNRYVFNTEAHPFDI